MSEMTYNTENKSFVMYKDWQQHFDLLDDSELGQIMRAVYAFASGKEVVEFEDRSLRIIFNMIKECMIRDNIKWDETKQKRRESGAKGGKAKAENAKLNSAKLSSAKADVASLAVNENDYVNENENEYVNVNENAKELDKIRLSDDEKHILYSLADRQTIDRYILNIIDWQKSSGKINTKPYVSIRRWLDEDGILKERGENADIKHYKDKQIEEFERYADSIDFSTLST